MLLSQLLINNYKSFPATDTVIDFDSRRIIIGKNNSGKSNILSAIDFLLGNKDPRYNPLAQQCFFDTNKPLRISAFLSMQNAEEIYRLPLAKKYQGILYKEFKDGKPAFVEIQYHHSLVKNTDEEDNEENDGTEKKDSKFQILINSKFPVYQKIKEFRAGLCRLIKIDSLRNAKDDLSGSRWTVFGQMMKSIIENSERYTELKAALNSLSLMIEEILAKEKEDILKNAKIISFINDIKFQLTKDNEPSELLRNLELYVQDRDKFIHVDETGTGTQSALIIAVLEVALRYKSSNARIFIVDEPELFLHPLGVRYLGQLFSHFIEDNISQIIIATHSPILLSSFRPRDIIRLDKPEHQTAVHQLPHDFADVNRKLSRQIYNGQSAEIFFAEKVMIVEGETEAIIFPNLSFDNTETHFYKNNICVANAQGKETIISIIKTLDLLNIKWKAVVDNDFFDMKKTYEPVCDHLGIAPDTEKEAMRKQMLQKGLWVLEEGETENLIPDSDLATLSGKSVDELSKLKSARKKLSDTFEKELFGKPKPEIAYEIVEYYRRHSNSPFNKIIKWVLT